MPEQSIATQEKSHVLRNGAIVGAIAVAAGVTAYALVPGPEDTPRFDGDVVADVQDFSNQELCVTNLETRFYADEATGNRFGPAASEVAYQDANRSFGELIERICSSEDDKADPMLLVGLNEHFELTAPSDPAGRDAEMVTLMNDQTKWNDDALWFVADLSKAELELVTESGDYYTQYAIANQNDGRPGIYQSQEDMTDKTLLKFTFPDGRVKYLKLDCGFQPVSLIEFPGVPHLPEDEKPTPPGTGTTKPSNPGTTGTTGTTGSTQHPQGSTTTTKPVNPKNAQPPVPGGPSTTVEAPVPSGPEPTIAPPTTEKPAPTPSTIIDDSPDPTSPPTSDEPRR